MAVFDWIQFNGIEFINSARTVQLARAMGIGTVRLPMSSVAWIQGAVSGGGLGFGYGGFGLGGFGVGGGDTDYSDITEAPWYIEGHPASAEFAGILPVNIDGLDDSSLESKTVEYITDGGNSSAPRNKTQVLVASVILVAKTDRGAEYGKRWMDRTLRAGGTKMFCSGSDLVYFRSVPPTPDEAQRVRRRDVSLTRGSTVTWKRKASCSSLWGLTFTWTANDPFEYGEYLDQFDDLGGVVIGPGVDSDGSIVLIQNSCPVYNYTPIYDPQYPALVPPPTAPDFYPAGWDIEDGMTFERFWVRLAPVQPSVLNLIPVIRLQSETEARRVRVSIWSSDADPETQCDPLFSVVVNYLPANSEFYVDGEQKASYIWDGASPLVRRADSLVYAPDAGPVNWTAFYDPVGLLVTLDVFSESGEYEGDGDVRVAMVLLVKSD